MTEHTTILITGVSSGIGENLAKHFLGLKHNVIGFSRRKTNFNSQQYLGVECDVRSCESVETAFAGLEPSLKINTLINCSGITLPTETTQGIDDFKQTFEVNVMGVYRVILQSMPFLKRAGNPNIINVASIGGLTGFSGNPAYGASKAAIVNLTQSLAMDFGKYQIRVNSVSPGYFKTKMTEGSFKNPEMRALRERQTILGRYGELRELMSIFEFLSSKKSSYVTGQNFIIDGGWMAKGFIE